MFLPYNMERVETAIIKSKSLIRFLTANMIEGCANIRKSFLTYHFGASFKLKSHITFLLE